MLISKQGDWVSAKVGEELVMMSTNEGKYIGLNEVGAYIWKLIDRPQTARSLCDCLMREFDVEPKECRSEVDAFIASLVSHNAVRLSA